jgi:heat shock protein HslJ
MPTLHRTNRLTVFTLALAAACTPAAVPGGSSEPPSAASAAAVPLENTAWTLVDVGGTPARPIGSGAAGPTLRLNAAEKRVSGDTGCNMYAGPYQLSGATLRFGPLISTRRACIDEALNRQEAALLGALDNVRSFRIDDDTLTVSGDAGPVARFVASR